MMEKKKKKKKKKKKVPGSSLFNTQCYVEECADTNTWFVDLSPTNTSVEMDCATRVHVTRNGGYINGSV